MNMLYTVILQTFDKQNRLIAKRINGLFIVYLTFMVLGNMLQDIRNRKIICVAVIISHLINPHTTSHNTDGENVFS